MSLPNLNDVFQYDPNYKGPGATSDEQEQINLLRQMNSALGTLIQGLMNFLIQISFTPNQRNPEE